MVEHQQRYETSLALNTEIVDRSRMKSTGSSPGKLDFPMIYCFILFCSIVSDLFLSKIIAGEMQIMY